MYFRSTIAHINTDKSYRSTCKIIEHTYLLKNLFHSRNMFRSLRFAIIENNRKWIIIALTIPLLSSASYNNSHTHMRNYHEHTHNYCTNIHLKTYTKTKSTTAAI